MQAIAERTSTGTTEPPDPNRVKLQRAARQFEAMLIQSLLESARRAFGAEEGSDAGSNTLTDMGLQAAASGIAGAGGLGIARMMLRQLEPALRSSLPEQPG